MLVSDCYYFNYKGGIWRRVPSRGYLPSGNPRSHALGHPIHDIHPRKRSLLLLGVVSQVTLGREQTYARACSRRTQRRVPVVRRQDVLMVVKVRYKGGYTHPITVVSIK